ncbi:unnamed protein product [Orchesella dallaii]|uniref:Uncharacterized protein n=1 Tax=Orchesella dallaii TaxID=48710 RepID=A0ABP1R5I5_9HEXA
MFRLKRKAEVRFNDYPEVFIDELPTPLADLERDGKAGCLKYRDKEGRRIGAWNGGRIEVIIIVILYYFSL